MEKNYRKNQITSSNSKIAREQFKAKKEAIMQNNSFIKKMTSRKLKKDVATTPESSLIQARIAFAEGRMTALNEMSSILENCIADNKTINRADRIIASYLSEKREMDKDVVLL